MTPRAEMLWHEVHWPHPLSREHALGLLRRLATDLHRDPVAWEAWGESGIVRYFLGTSIEAHHRITRLIEELVPGSIVESVESVPEFAGTLARLRVSQAHVSLDVSNSEHVLSAVLAGLAAARARQESVVTSILIQGGISPMFIGAKPSDPTRSLAQTIIGGSVSATPELRSSLRDKASQFRLRVAIHIGATALSSERKHNLIAGVFAGLRTLEGAGVRLGLSPSRPTALSTKAPWWTPPLTLTVEELLVMLAWPIGENRLPGQPALHPKQLRAASAADTDQRDFAESTAPGTKVPIGISTADSLYHSLFIGPTGSGKSTVLLNLIVRDMREGKAVVVIDPKADLVSSILSRIPKDRRTDVVVLDPTHATPVGLNPLAGATERNKELVADGILAVFKDLFAASWGIRASDVFHASLLTLANHGHASLLWLPRLLTDASFRRTLTGALDDPIGLEAFWAQFESMSPQQQAQVISPALSRLRQLLLRPSLLNVLGQVNPKFDLSDFFEKKRILLVPLNKGLIGPEAARLLGSLLVAQLWQLTLARAALPESDRHPVSIIVDEMQDYLSLPTDLAEALSQSRSLGVAWHLAHQYRNQLNDSLRAAVDANARNTIAFGMDVADATAMARMTPELSAEDFMALPRFHIYASLMASGEKQPWVSGRTLPPPEKTSTPAAILARSTKSYGQSLTAADLGQQTPAQVIPTEKDESRRPDSSPPKSNGSASTEQFGRRPKGES